MPLKAKKPDPAKKRMKAFVFGIWGSGKTMAAIQFPHSVIIDTEKGTENYSRSINNSESVVLMSSNSDEIKDEIKVLLTEKHNYRTLTIDPVTELRNAIQEKWTRVFDKYAKTEKEVEMQDYGMRYWAKVNGEYKSVLRMLKQLDMNVFLTAHQKDVYDGNTKSGVGPDSGKNDLHMFDYAFQVRIENGKLIAKTVKERAEIGEPKFPKEFEWSYQNFCNYYGKDEIEKESAPVPLATAEQAKELYQLISVVNVDKEEVQKWLDKADCDEFSEMTEAQILKCIDHVKKKLQTLTGGK